MEKKNYISLWERCKGPQRGGVQKCYSHDHPVTWKQMSHCQEGGGWKWGCWMGIGYRNANTSSFLLFPETKVRFSVWLTEQKRTEDVTCAFLLHVQFPGKLNLGWSWNLLGVLLGRDKEEDCVRGWPVSPDPYSLH